MGRAGRERHVPRFAQALGFGDSGVGVESHAVMLTSILLARHLNGSCEECHLLVLESVWLRWNVRTRRRKAPMHETEIREIIIYRLQ